MPLTETKTLELNIKGMSCSNCALRIERALNQVPTVEGAWVSYPLSKAVIRTKERNLDTLLEVIKQTGYEASLPQKANPTEELKKLKHRLIANFILSLPFFAGMVFHFFGLSEHGSGFVEFFISLPVVFYLAWPFYRGGFYALKNKLPNMDVLVSLGIMVPFFYSSWSLFFKDGKNLYYEISVILPFFILLGKYIESQVRQQVQGDVIGAMGFSSQKVRLKEENLSMVQASDLKIGQKILVLPGEVIPVDGVIVEGNSAVNEIIFTGESLPQEKSMGDFVYQGTTNLNQPIVVQVKNSVFQSRYMNLLRLLAESQFQRSTIQRFADKIAFYFVPAIIFLAIFVFFYWFYYTNLLLALERALAVLVISCPCAFGLATPISLFIATNFALKQGILIRSPEAIERAWQVKKVFLDKTGTLTKESLVLEKIEILNKDYQESEVLELAASLVIYSNHPLAKALVKKAQEKALGHKKIILIKEEAGLGIRGVLEEQGLEIKIGSAKYVKVNFENQHLPQVFLSIGGVVVAAFTFKEEVREEAFGVIQWLLSQKYEVILLSGDKSEFVEKLAEKLQIPFQKGLSPEQKQQILQKNPHSAMVGDGLNDGLALSKAYLGIAFQSMESLSLVKELALVVLLNSDLRLLPKFFILAKKTRQNILQNYFWAIFYNSLALPLAFFGYLSPLIAGLAMSFSSVFVVINSVFLKKILQSKFKKIA